MARLGVRAGLRRFYAHASVTDLLGREPTVVRLGVSVADHYQIDVVAIDEFESYVPSASLPTLIRRFGLEEQSEGTERGVACGQRRVVALRTG